MRLKNNKVWLATDADGNPMVRNNKVLIKYQLDQEHEYWVHPQGVTPIESDRSAPDERSDRPPGDSRSRKKSGRQSPSDAPPAAPEEGAVYLFTDGASSGNPGPSGIGVVLRYGDHTKEISRSIGIATNNIAELEAIRAALLELKKTHLPVRIFTDSSYAYGVLTLGWKPRKNRELIRSTQELMAAFEDLKLIKVKGHSGIAENERADLLATGACRRTDGRKA